MYLLKALFNSATERCNFAAPPNAIPVEIILDIAEWLWFSADVLNLCLTVPLTLSLYAIDN
jgi:hypothetical protein